MPTNNPWQEFIDAADRKAFHDNLMMSVRVWVTQWLEANAMKGDKGARGEQGLKGDKGDRGEQGPRGERGARGYDGKDGVDGLPGAKGDIGIPGRDGKDGVDGRDGKDGKRGQRGPKGLKGDKGDRGPVGPQGPPGGGGGGGTRRYKFLGGDNDPTEREGIAEDKYTYLSLRMVQDLIQLKRPRLSLVLGNLCNGRFADSFW